MRRIFIAGLPRTEPCENTWFLSSPAPLPRPRSHRPAYPSLFPQTPSELGFYAHNPFPFFSSVGPATVSVPMILGGV